MEKIMLNGDWTVRFVHPETNESHNIPAKVPGNIELDLERAGLITDALPADRRFACHWVSITDWEFEREFEYNGLPEGAVQANLNFAGIDTIADIYLNGEKIHHSENMQITQTVDVTDLLKIGKNHLSVRIFAPEYYARKFPHKVFAHSPGRTEALYLRKAKHMWGWDNAPHRLSAGIWRDVFIDFLEPVRFDDVYVVTDWIDYENDAAVMNVRYSMIVPERDLRPYRLRVRMVRNGVAEMDRSFEVRHTRGMLGLESMTLQHPALWNPVGFGEPNMYDFILTLEKDGVAVAEHKERIGIRIIRLERSEVTDAEGSGEFQFYCNEQKIYMRGTNWKPLSPYHSQIPERMQRALNLLVECNCNMVRVWGGGIYEDHEFFDFCDENGIMVWQDFMLACEFPPKDEFFLKELYHEAEFIIKKYRNHPSLALWCGDNENDMFWNTCTGRTLPPSSCRVTRELLPEALSEFDPFRDYVPSSPYISDELYDRRKSQFFDYLASAPEQHIYSGHNLPDGYRAFFRPNVAHFSSEIGPIGINAMSESADIYERELPRLKRLWNTDPFSIERTPMMHQSDFYCTFWCKCVKDRTLKMFGKEFGPDNPEDLFKAVNFYVADLFKVSMESWRIQKFRRTGMLWWSLLDMWPMAFNYSVVDSNFRKKFPFEALRLAQQPVILAGKDPEGGEMPELHVVNDTAYEQKGTWKALDPDGKELCSGTFQVEPNGKAKIGSLPLAVKEYCFLEWDCGKYSGKNYYMNPGEPYDFEECCKLMERVRALR